MQISPLVPRMLAIVLAVGLMMDVHNSDLLGLHAFSYSLVSFIAVLWHRRIVALRVYSQALHLLPIFLLVSLFPVLAHWVLDRKSTRLNSSHT